MKKKLRFLCVVLVLLLLSVTSVSGSSTASSEKILPPGEMVTPEVIPGQNLEHQSTISQSATAYVTQLSMSGPYYIFLPKVIVPRIFYVSIEGNDNNPGTQTNPWRTILKATNSLKSGDIAIIQAGTYQEEPIITSSGVTFQAQGKVITGAFTIYGNYNTIKGFTITDPNSDWGIWTKGGSYNLIEGNEIYHTKQDGIWFFGSHNTFRGNYLHDVLDPSVRDAHNDCFQSWGGDYGATDILFDRNICVMNVSAINENQQVVMLERKTAQEVRNITFTNNIFVIYHPSWSALNFWYNEARVSNLTVNNNTIVNMGRSPRQTAQAITFYNVDNATVINNLFINFGNISQWPTRVATNAIGTDGSTGLTIHNNAFYNIDGVSPNDTPYPGDIWMQDPRLVNLSDLDFHLQSNSPLVDTGYNLGNLVPNDFGGLPRPQGVRYDIGAYEFPKP